MATRPYQGIKFDSEGARKVLDNLTVEEALQININEQPFTVSMRTPGDDAALVRGMLHAEDIISDTALHPELLIKKENDLGIVTIVNITIPENKLGRGYNNSRSLLSVSSCGICGKTELSDLAVSGNTISNREKLDAGLVPLLFDRMRTRQMDFNKSGGTHAAMAFTMEGEPLCAMEDIGRHNAVDKVVGQLLLDRALPKARILTVSGRISYEIVIKCFKAGIPFLAAVSAPSSLAVDYAKELGITLFAFSRNGRTTCYAHPEQTGIHANNNTKVS